MTAPPAPFEHYPFPLANGQVAILMLPRRLTPEDAERIVQFLESLVVAK